MGDAMLTFSQNGNFAALDAVTDYLTADQKIWLSDTPATSNTLRSIMMHDQPWESSDDGQIALVVRDFMTKLGATVDHYALGDAMVTFAQNGNFAALDAATDYLTTDQKIWIGGTLELQNTIFYIAQHDMPFTGSDDAAIASHIRDIASKFGDQMEDFAILNAVSDLNMTGNIVAVDSIIGELSSQKLDAGLIADLNGILNPGTIGGGAIILGTHTANTYQGTAGQDTYFGLGGNDKLYGNDGDDRLFGDAGTDTLYGGNDRDTLHGGSGNDTLFGDAGDDLLIGGLGTDYLTGGAGSDTFLFEASAFKTGTDYVRDFSVLDNDVLDISDILVGYDPLTDTLAEFVKLTTSGTNTTISVDADGALGGQSFAAVAILQNVTGLDLNTLVDSGKVVV